ncbi:hypothetical protein JAAARDRAFT_204844 [Jaapia argillacea MUCL 33604]|uniref:Hemerythrin-like domain-containing protein n=1 Tax=Jaapia argillacea MUCL 33604 TaxID=933084 RepID=A0A067Q291_9AGAM|nr:hypothetical protein JAAARDRAFT_204844 [Jaapia argillacea MUCL 33604]
MATVQKKLDVTHEIKLDHDNVRDLWSRYQQATTRDNKAVLANTLIREMAVHGDAEEVSIYNDYARLGLPGTAEHNKEEHAEIKKLVYAADSASTKSEEYDEVLGRAVNAFLEHAGEEEGDQFGKIKEALDAEENHSLAVQFLQARKMVPTRPHPMAPQTGGVAQKTVGAWGAFHDKVVENLGGRSFADLKYEHPDVSLL